MAAKNSTILGRFYLSGTNDMQQRLDNPTQGSVRKTLQQLFDPMNGDLYNQFMDFMVQRIGYAYAHQQRWENPLREFVKQKLYYGSTVTETQLNWIKCHSYDVDAEEQFKTRYPNGLQAFHSINSQRQYSISISKEQMRQAVGDEYGLNQLIAAVMQQPMNSDEYDMYNLMLDLFKQADENYTLFRHQLSSAPTDKESCNELLQALRQYSYDLTVPTSIYACADLPVVVQPDELVLFIRSDSMAATDVQTLAVVFNLEKADIPYRTKVIPVDKWPLRSDDYAVLTTSDFFQVYTTEYSTTSKWDPMGLKTNYWLNDWNIISFSPFVPIIVFTTDTGTQVQAVTMEPTGLALAVDSSTVAPGGTVRITPTLSGTFTPDADYEQLEVAPDACVFTVFAVDENDAPVSLNSRTYVDRYGVLHVQKTIAEGTKLTVSAVSAYLNPDGATAPLTDKITVTVA